MRNLIPRLPVVVARDRSRAERMLAGLVLGQEVFLQRLTAELLKVTDNPDPDCARVLGVVPGEWSRRINTAEASGRPCRAWFVGELPSEKTHDGSIRLVLTVWCSSRSSGANDRDPSVDELLQGSRLPDVPWPEHLPSGNPFRKSRLHQEPSALPPRTTGPARAVENTQHPASGLAESQLERIRAAVRKKLGRNPEDI